MTGAVALAIVLVIAVVGMSLALQSQRASQSTQSPRQPKPRPTPTPRRRERDQRPSPAPPPPKSDPDPEPKLPELLHSGATADAKVISVIDERTIGPVTRSRLTLRIEPEGESAFEVTTRVAFPTPGARSAVKVGGTVPVRYDKEDHSRVVVDVPLQ